MSDWTSQLPPGRPSLPAALAFFFAGVGAISSQIRRAGNLSDWCATLVVVISYLTLIGYIYGLSVLYESAMESTALLLALVAVTLYAMRSEAGIAQLVLTSDAGGVVFRRVLAAILLLMPFFGLIEIRFFTTKRHVGTGLGLYISRELAQKNGGALRVESSTVDASPGAKFTLMLPLAPAQRERARLFAPKQPKPKPSCKCP